MRKVIVPQMKLGELAIADIKLNPKSRDDIPQILRGLQHIYTTPELRGPIFAILEEVLLERQIEGKTVKADPNNGRPGMTQWQILVLGVLRLGLNTDYDRIQELANEHKTLRQMLGHSDWADEKYYNLQTLKDNLRLFTPEILDRLNRVIVLAGHQALKIWVRCYVNRNKRPLNANADLAKNAVYKKATSISCDCAGTSF